MHKVLLLSALFVFLSCGGKRGIVVYDNVEDQFEVALESYNRGDYESATEGFKRVIFNFPTSSFADDAQYYLALSYFKMKDYEDAILEYQFLLDNFPNSDYKKEALLGIAQSYYEKSPRPELDQSDTKKTIFYIRQYLSRYPNSDGAEEARELLQKAKTKLAKRLLISAKTYRNLGAYTSEKIYLEILLQEYPDTDVVWEARYLLGEVLNHLGNKEEAREVLDDILKNPAVSADIRTKAEELRKKI